MAHFQLLSLISMSGIYILAGIGHFWRPAFFLKIMPRWVPCPEQVNLLVGLIEIGLGIGLLFPLTRSLAAWGIMALLIAVCPANVHHFQKARQKGTFVWPTLIRLPVQGLLIYWAYCFTL